MTNRRAPKISETSATDKVVSNLVASILDKARRSLSEDDSSSHLFSSDGRVCLQIENRPSGAYLYVYGLGKSVAEAYSSVQNNLGWIRSELERKKISYSDIEIDRNPDDGAPKDSKFIDDWAAESKDSGLGVYNFAVL